MSCFCVINILYSYSKNNEKFESVNFHFYRNFRCNESKNVFDVKYFEIFNLSLISFNDNINNYRCNDEKWMFQSLSQTPTIEDFSDVSIKWIQFCQWFVTYYRLIFHCFFMTDWLVYSLNCNKCRIYQINNWKTSFSSIFKLLTHFW